jgi:hypothetical protein
MKSPLFAPDEAVCTSMVFGPTCRISVMFEKLFSGTEKDMEILPPNRRFSATNLGFMRERPDRLLFRQARIVASDADLRLHEEIQCPLKPRRITAIIIACSSISDLVFLLLFFLTFGGRIKDFQSRSLRQRCDNVGVGFVTI